MVRMRAFPKLLSVSPQERENNEPGWTPLKWAVCATHEATDRVCRVPWNDPRGAFAAIGEALWWIVVLGTSLAKPREGSAYAAPRERDPAGVPPSAGY